MPLDTTLVRAADCFIENETIDRVAGTIRSGKEAVVFKTEKSTPAGPAFGALKVYRPTTHRSFRNDQCYRQHGEPIDDTRLRRAVARGTRAAAGPMRLACGSTMRPNASEFCASVAPMCRPSSMPTAVRS